MTTRARIVEGDVPAETPGDEPTVPTHTDSTNEGVSNEIKPYYEQDGITIYNGDCRDYLSNLWFGVNLVIVDPPYGNSLDTDYFRPSTPASKTYASIFGNNEPFDPSPWLQFRSVLFGANHYADRLPITRGWIVWDKVTRNDVKAGQISDGEMAWTNCLPRLRIFRHMWNGAFRDSERGFHVHPTQKPVALMRWILEMTTGLGDLVLDPYMGSGSVAQACNEIGRRYIGIEIEENYCEIAAKRLGQRVLPL